MKETGLSKGNLSQRYGSPVINARVTFNVTLNKITGLGMIMLSYNLPI